LLHRGKFFPGLAKLRNREWIPVLHQTQSLATRGVQGKLPGARMGYILRVASHEGGCTFSRDSGRFDYGIERALPGQVFRTSQQSALSPARPVEADSAEPGGL
jgi:hypothetical protein